MNPKSPGKGGQLPTSIGRYRVDGRIGRGAMGVVYCAHDALMNRRVAIKVMMADLEDDPETAERFHREAYAAGQLIHRNLVTIFDVGDDDGRPYIVMELLESRTLAEYLKRAGGVGLEEKIELMMQLCEGLQVAHGKGIVHRDVKPGNLLISDEGELKIVDFGIARLASSNMTLTGLIVGTPDFMSPEQAAGREVDERSDLFSAGAVFYFMLTGRKPFASSDVRVVLDRVQSDDPLPIRDTEAPPALVAVVMKALAKSPAARYQTAALLAADLRRVVRDLAAEAARIGDEILAELDAAVGLCAQRDALCVELDAVPEAADITVFHAPPDPRLGWAATHARGREVAAVREALDQELAKLVRALADVRRSETATKTGDLAEALRCLDAAQQAAPSSARIAAAIDRTRGLVAEKRATQDRANTLVVEANDAASRSDWATVLALTAQALAADPSNRPATALRDRAITARRAEAQARRQQSEKALQRAEKFASKGRYADAEEAVGEARTLDPDSADVSGVALRIRTARLDAERASAAERRMAEAIAAARALFDAGERARALADLGEFLSREPHAQGAASALTALRAEADRLAAEDRRKSAAADAAMAAEAALASDDLERAVSLARQALASHAADPLARQIEGMATARLKERAVLRERHESAARAMQSARDHLARGKFRAARDSARLAATLHPEDDAPTLLVATILSEETKAAERIRQEEDARRRAEAAAPIVAMAEAAEAQRDFIRAGWLAENALALDVDCAEARGVLDRAQAALAAAPTLADETVRIGSDGRAVHDPDDTLTLNPVISTWRRFGKTLIQRLAAPLKGRLGGRDAGRNKEP